VRLANRFRAIAEFCIRILRKTADLPNRSRLISVPGKVPDSGTVGGGSMGHSGPFFWEAQRNRRLDEDGSRQIPTSRAVDDRTLDVPRAKHPLDGGISFRKSEAGQEPGSPMSAHECVDRGQRLQGVDG